MLNYGTSISYWILLTMSLFIIFLTYMTGRSILMYMNDGTKESIRRMIFWCITSLAAAVLMFTGYGVGTMRLQSTSGDIGWSTMQLETKDRPIDSVRNETEKSRPHALKRQDDPGFDEEKDEADKYLKELGLD